MTRALICHKGEGKVILENGKRRRLAASYSKFDQVRALIRYTLSPARDSQDRERVVAVEDGLGLGLADAEVLTPSEVAYVTEQLIDGVPVGRRRIRHVILALAGHGTLEEQVKICRKLCRGYVSRWAPGCSFIGVVHDDHFGEDGRGLHVHLIIRNSDAAGRALDWNRDDLKAQQGMAWAAGIGVVPTRGTGSSPPDSKKLPYPKSKNLVALKLSSLNQNEIESYVSTGRLTVGRRDKNGNVASVIIDGRRVRLSTARALVERERRLALLGSGGGSPPGAVTIDDLLNPVGTTTPLPAVNQSERRRDRSRPLGVGFDSGGSPVEGRNQRGGKRSLRAVRAGARRVTRAVARSLAQIDDLGRGM
jgi:hypothetical protein